MPTDRPRYIPELGTVEELLRSTPDPWADDPQTDEYRAEIAATRRFAVRFVQARVGPLPRAWVDRIHLASREWCHRLITYNASTDKLCDLKFPRGRSGEKCGARAHAPHIGSTRFE